MAEEKAEKKKVKKPTALKRELQNERKKLRNRVNLSRMKTAVRSLKESDQKKEKLSTVFSLIDKGVKKGSLKLNKANRLKSKLAKESK